MKKKISICLDEELVERIRKELEKGIFRSRSHVIEFLLNKNLKSQAMAGNVKNVYRQRCNQKCS